MLSKLSHLASEIIAFGNFAKQVFVTNCNLLAFNFGMKLAMDAR